MVFFYRSCHLKTIASSFLYKHRRIWNVKSAQKQISAFSYSITIDLHITQKDIVGYTKSYAPHVEYGHRKIGGGWVNGQFYLKKGVEHQRKIYKDTLLKQIKKEGG